jgi:hypothetical protein
MDKANGLYDECMTTGHLDAMRACYTNHRYPDGTPFDRALSLPGGQEVLPNPFTESALISHGELLQDCYYAYMTGTSDLKGDGFSLSSVTLGGGVGPDGLSGQISAEWTDKNDGPLWEGYQKICRGEEKLAIDECRKELHACRKNEGRHTTSQPPLRRQGQGAITRGQP